MWNVWDLWEGGLDKIGRVVYNRFKMKNKVDYKTSQRIGGNSSPNLLHLPGRCYSFETNIGCTESAYALKPPWCFVQSMKNHGGLDV